MNLKRFKNIDKKTVGIIVFTVCCVFLVAGVFLFRSFALYETHENFNVITGTVESPGDFSFSFYVGGKISETMPQKTSGYGFSGGECSNGATVDFDNRTWSPTVLNMTKSHTKCTLRFLKKSTLRDLSTYTNEDYQIIDDTQGMWGYRADITKIIIQNNLNPIEGAAYSFDESEAQDGSIMSYLVLNEDGTTYSAYLQGNGGIYANPDSSYLFLGFNVVSIEGLKYLDTSKVTDMSHMFSYMSRTPSLDISSFDTSNVTNMYRMFSFSDFTSLDLHSLDATKVTNMDEMFFQCNGLTSINLRGFDTLNVTSMSHMFVGVENLVTLDLSGFNTSNVENMEFMFGYMSKLENLNISSFDTSSVTNMRSMFEGCSSLISLDLSNFDTSNVTAMSGMFYDMSSLSSLNVSSFDTRNVEIMSNMFANSSKLKNIAYGTNFIHNTNCDVINMYSNCPANKPTDASWDGYL